MSNDIFKSLDELYTDDTALLENKIKQFDAFLKALLTIFPSITTHDTSKVMSSVFSCESVQGDRDDHHRAISYDPTTNRIVADKVVAWKNTYDSYMQQHYDYRGIFIDKLESEMGIPIRMTELYINNIDDTASKELIRDTITALSNDNDVSEDKIKSIELSQTFKWYDNAVKAGADKEKAKAIALSENQKEKAHFYNETVKTNIIQNLSSREIEYISNICQERKHNPDEIPPELKEKVKLMEASGYWNIFKAGLEKGFKLKQIIEHILSLESVSDVRDWLAEIEIRKRNQLYLEMIDSDHIDLDRFPGKSALEQLFILESLYERNSSGNMVQKTVTKDMIESICEDINSWEPITSITSKQYRPSHIKSIIRLVFNLKGKMNGKKSRSLRIRSLKLPRSEG